MLVCTLATLPAPTPESLAARVLFAFGMLALLTLTLLSSASALFSLITTYPTAERYPLRMLSLYVAVIVTFANWYFWLVVLHPNEHWFAGLTSPFAARPNSHATSELTVGPLLRCVVDCVHFSCVTIATVGYGDIYPVAPVAKLLVDVEIISGLAIIVIGFGRLFASRTG
jgi:hypothetical protein